MYLQLFKAINAFPDPVITNIWTVESDTDNWSIGWGSTDVCNVAAQYKIYAGSNSVLYADIPSLTLTNLTQCTPYAITVTHVDENGSDIGIPATLNIITHGVGKRLQWHELFIAKFVII